MRDEGVRAELKFLTPIEMLEINIYYVKKIRAKPRRLPNYYLGT